jgi:transcriptional regulator with XRE-family HTH domain
MTPFSEALKAEMLKAGLTQAELSRLTSIPQPTISAYLRGTREPQMDMLKRLIGVFPSLLQWVVDRLSAPE